MTRCGVLIVGTFFALAWGPVFLTAQTQMQHMQHKQQGHVTAMHLQAQPSNYNGRCPVTIHFVGSITSNGPQTMEYRIDRSDGAKSGGERLTFNAAGSHRVTDTWRLSESYAGWEMLGTGNMRSNRATFRVNCARKQIHMQ